MVYHWIRVFFVKGNSSLKYDKDPSTQKYLTIMAIQKTMERKDGK